VLEADLENPEALLHLGLIAVRGGHLDFARLYAVRLLNARKTGSELALLSIAIADTAIDRRELQKARVLAEFGEFDRAVAAYGKLFPLATPSPDLAPEYYETLAGTAAGWEKAVAGLERLTTALPSDRPLALALARVRTYREQTRRAGLADFARLNVGTSPMDGTAAAWRSALLWLNATRDDIPLYRAYLSSYPADRTIGARLASLTGANSAAHSENEIMGAHLPGAAKLSPPETTSPQNARPLPMLRNTDNLVDSLVRSPGTKTKEISAPTSDPRGQRISAGSNQGRTNPFSAAARDEDQGKVALYVTRTFD
jgi:tetratricopeptide (TPR) repeat protein